MVVCLNYDVNALQSNMQRVYSKPAYLSRVCHIFGTRPRVFLVAHRTATKIYGQKIGMTCARANSFYLLFVFRKTKGKIN